MPKRTKPSYRELQRQLATRKQAAEAVAEHAQRLELARTVTREISCELDLPKLLQRIVQLTTVRAVADTTSPPGHRAAQARASNGAWGQGPAPACAPVAPNSPNVPKKLKDPGGGPQAQPLGPTRQHAYHQLHRRLLAMQEGAMSGPRCTL